MTYFLLHILYALDPTSAPLPVALFMLAAASFLFWKMLTSFKA